MGVGFGEKLLHRAFDRSFSDRKVGCDFFIELGPGGVLAGLLRRAFKGVDVMSVSDVDSVRKCADAL